MTGRLSPKKLAKAIEEGLVKFNLSEARLAEAVGCSQKSINRYRNGNYCQDLMVEKRIIAYFDALENEQIQIGQRILTEEDLISLNEPDLFQKEMFSKEADVLQFFVPNAQKYITTNLHAFWALEDYEIKFVEKIRGLTTEHKRQVFVKMEEFPVSLGMLCEESDCSNNFLEFKLPIYLSIIRSEIPKRIRTSIEEETGQYKSVLRLEIRKDFLDRCMQLFSLCCQMPDNLKGNIETAMEYERNDWYALFLLERIRLLDKTDENSCKYYDIINGHKGKLREKQIWDLIGMLHEEQDVSD